MPLGIGYGQNAVNRRLNRVNAQQPVATQPMFQQAQRLTPATPTLPARPTMPAVNRPAPAQPADDNFRQNILNALLQSAQPAPAPGGEGPFSPESFRGASRQFGQRRVAPQGTQQPRQGLGQGIDRNVLGRLMLQLLQRRRQNAAPRRLL